MGTPDMRVVVIEGGLDSASAAVMRHLLHALPPVEPAPAIA
jgi:hypothetical protein